MSLTKKLYVALGLSDKEFNAKLKGVTTKINQAARDMNKESRRLSISTQEIFFGLTLPLGLMAKSIFSATSQIEKLNLGLKAIAQSAGIENVKALTDEVERLAKLPGLSLEQASNAMQQLISVGASAKSASRIIEGLGIGIARAGGSAEEFGRVLRQMIQALGKGKLEMQDFKTVFEQIPVSRRILEDAFGPGMSDLENLRNAGKGPAAVIKALVDGLHELGAEGFMDSLSNKTENLSDKFLLLKAAIGQEIFGHIFKQGLDSAASGIDKLTSAIKGLSPQTKEMIGNIVLAIAKFAIFVPFAGFAKKTLLALGSVLLTQSTLFRGLATHIGLASGAGKGFIALIARIPLIGASAAGALGGIGAAARVMGKAFRLFIPIIGEVLLAFEILRTIFPQIDGWISKIWGKLKGMNKETQKVMGDASSAAFKFKKGNVPLSAVLDMGLPSKPSKSGLTPKVDWGLDNFIDSLDEKKVEDVADSFDHMRANLIKLKEVVDAVDESYKKNGIIGPQAQISRVLAMKPQGIPGGADLAADKRNLFDVASVVNNLREYIAGINEAQAITDQWKGALNEMFSGELAEGILGLGGAFSTFLDVVVSNGQDAFGAFANALKAAVKDMLAALIGLIAKLAIVAALWSIFAPAGGVKGLKGAFDFIKGGNGGFLGGLLGGVLGFADGGVVPGQSKYGDKILARLNSGELVMNEAQQEKAYQQMTSGSLNIGGNWVIRGRDLVYVVEKNQAQINSSR